MGERGRRHTGGMAVTLGQLQTERDATFTAMGTLRAGGLTVTIGGRTLTRSSLGELQRQYEWLCRRIARLTTRRSVVGRFQEPG